MIPIMKDHLQEFIALATQIKERCDLHPDKFKDGDHNVLENEEDGEGYFMRMYYSEGYKVWAFYCGSVAWAHYSGKIEIGKDILFDEGVNMNIRKINSHLQKFLNNFDSKFGAKRRKLNFNN